MILSIILILLVVALDQATKYLTTAQLALGETFPVIKDIFHFTYVENRGAAFGMLAEHRWVFMIISIIGIAALFVWLVISKPQNKWISIGISFIIGGGIGNMIDRLVHGYVVDMIDCRFINFAVFNVADTFVCVGCAMVVIGLLIDLVRERRAGKESKSTGADSGAESND